MKYVVLLMALIFIGWLLWRELWRRPSLSAAVWIPTVLMMVLGSRPLSGWVVGGYDYSRGSASLLDQSFFLFVLAGSLVIASSRGVNWVRFLGANLPLMLLYAYFVASIIWSDDPAGSAVRIVKDFGLLVVVGLIYSEKEPLQAIRAVFIRSACVLFPLSIVFNRYFPSFGREFSPNGSMQLSGVTLQKNSLGEIVFVFCIFILWDYIDLPASSRRRGLLRGMPWDYVALLLMGIVLLKQSQSKTALVCLVLAAALSVRKGAFASRTVSMAVFAAVLSTPFLLFFTRSFGDIIQPVVAALGRDMTFTGRTNIWDHITFETVNPMIGCGFWNFWQGPHGIEISREINWSIPTAHCGYLDIYLDGGVLGLVALLYVLVAYGRRLIKRGQEGRIRVVGLAVLSTAIIYNLSESSFLRIGPLWFATVLMMVEFPQKRKNTNKVQRGRSNAVPMMREASEVPECLPVR